MLPESMVETHRDGDQIFFAFVCPGCGAEGKLGILSTERGLFGCPKHCGATFLPWLDGEKWKLTCVVCPVFEDDGGPDAA